MIKQSIVAIIAVSMLSGCVIAVGGDHDRYSGDWKETQEKNRQLISQLQIGSSIAQVSDILGEAADSEGFEKDDGRYTILYYRTQHRHSDGETTRDETTPVIFKDGRLLGWGTSLLHSVAP
ncbi:DUF3192 domain-containing protein [Pleionea sp. CnH1-48]|uniref:DUF3192 domain-containing protein n=1 Tax=Pleionea sp. CnH1-48 TaxID=2954494 RepID=UPI0020969BBC|nr:DUF3192 domain-containing protein [Pleionea sp. CnH1-48]MCO7226525.1 DUF3192 domain-containing protein [Pleionea sp. CnH1-48]